MLYLKHITVEIQQSIGMYVHVCFTGVSVNFKKELELAFGDYVEVYPMLPDIHFVLLQAHGSL